MLLGTQGNLQSLTGGLRLKVGFSTLVFTNELIAEVRIGSSGIGKMLSKRTAPRRPSGSSTP